MYAIDAETLGLPGDSRGDLEAAIKGHSLAMARFVGTYERHR